MTDIILPLPDYIGNISHILGLKWFQVETVLTLIYEGDTVPFIARYRKERTGNLDENHIRDIIDLQKKMETLHHAKETALSGILSLGKLTDELRKSIENARTLKEVEEIYKPYKSKRKTNAMIAIEKGFQIVADSLKKNKVEIPPHLLELYLPEEILEGAEEIIGAEISANTELRRVLLRDIMSGWILKSRKKWEKMLEKLNAKDQESIIKFDLYFDFSLSIHRLKPYQILALNRGEKLGILTVKIDHDTWCIWRLKNEYSKNLHIFTPFISELEKAFQIGYDALFWSVENEVRSDLSEIGEDDAIKTFQTNLYELLMTKPEYGKSILAIDPGYRAGCKICVLDRLSAPIFFDKVFLHSPEEARISLSNIIEKYSIDCIVIGNGTGSTEISDLVSELFSGDIFFVNESWASVYSASPIAQEEFPSLDTLDRGTVSIGRRYIDPLSELVKVPVGSIGVGMYQHDVSEKKLIEKLGNVIENVVNEVGINVNNSSVFVLSHISGIDKREAKKIYNHRPYHSRKDLEKVLWAKAYELAIGFLRVPESQEKLDMTDIHPDQYNLARYIIEHGLDQINYRSHIEKLRSLYIDFTETTLIFILEAYTQLWKEKRIKSSHIRAQKKQKEWSLQEWDICTGIIRNVVAFWAFVDIGMKNDGLIHVSQMADRFIKDPWEIVKVWDQVRVRITQIDPKTQKIQLSLRSLPE